MSSLRLFIDCDGVLLNTIEVLYGDYDLFVKTNPDISMSEWLTKINWAETLRRAGPLQDSVESIKKLPTDQVTILTTVQSVIEAKEKIKYIRELGLDNDIIIVPAGCDKNDVVSAKGNILIDDYKENLKKWQNAGGRAIQFHQSKKEGEFPIINSLSEIIWIKS